MVTDGTSETYATPKRNPEWSLSQPQGAPAAAKPGLEADRGRFFRPEVLITVTDNQHP